MGNTDSVPVVSQAKSLVQAISGDMEGAKKTQEQFLRTGLIASQVNSAVVAIQGDPEEARKIQEEFGEETLQILEGSPIIGHAMSAGYAAGGDLEKAEQVALTATKSTVVAGSALVSLACGPGAPACAAALGSAAVVGTNAAWDGVESLVRNETVGVINTVEVIKDMVERNETVDAAEVFDIAFEQTALAAGGAFAGFKLGKVGKVGKVAKTPAKVAGTALRVKCLCKREVQEIPANPLLLDTPSSITRLDLETKSVDSMVHSILSLFIILKLVFAKSKSTMATPYLAEICEAEGRAENLEDCHKWLLSAMQKFEPTQDLSMTSELFSEDPSPLLASLSTLAFAFDNMVAEDLVGAGLQIWLCSIFPLDQQEQCILRLRQGVREVQNMDLDTKEMVDEHVRVKRGACCASRNFRMNHFLRGSGDPLSSKVRNAKGLKVNTRIRTPKQTVYTKVFNKMAKGKFDTVEHRGTVQYRVKVKGLKMVDEVVGDGGEVSFKPRSGPVLVHVSQQGQLVHLSPA